MTRPAWSSNVASNPPTSGPGQPWPGGSSDTPGTGTPNPQSQWGQQPQSQWGQQPQSQWQQPQGQAPQGQWGQQQAQWPPRAGQAGQQPQSQWGQQPQSQWGQQPQSQWQQPQGQAPQGQWGQQPLGQAPQGQWGQQPQGQQQWGQQQQGQWQQPQGQQQWGQQPGANQWAPVIGTGWGDAEAAFAQDDYPVKVTFTPEGRIGRYWGIPVIGYTWLRALCLLPHFIALLFVYIVAVLASLLTWIPVLLTGRYPHWGYSLVGGMLRWWLRVYGWLWLLAGTYPSFTGADKDSQHIRVLFDEERPVGRFWGIPLVGMLLRAILAIPHYIVLALLSIVVVIMLLFVWIPVLVFGRQADLVYNVVGGWLRWGIRVNAYVLLMAGPYPPFRLD